MTPEESLALRIHAELADSQRVVERAHRQWQKARQTSDTDYLEAAALNLHAFYTGIERIFEMIAREIDESVPSGPQWHRDLLLQMSNDLPGRRPAVIRYETRVCLDEYRAFRHVVRHAYTFVLRPERVADLVQRLDDCFQQVRSDLETFCRFLERM